MESLFMCLKIFFVRIIDVSLGTFRTLTIVKGKTTFASIIGFVEVFIWFLIVREALNTDVTNVWVAISYSLGFATGTYLGGKISSKFIKTNLSFEIITSKKEMIELLREQGYAVTVFDVKEKGKKEEKYMLLSEIKNSSSNDLKELVKTIDENAFVIVTETKYVQNGYFK